MKRLQISATGVMYLNFLAYACAKYIVFMLFSYFIC